MLIAALALLSLASAQPPIDPANLQKAVDALPDLGRRAVDSGGVPGIAFAFIFDGKVQYAEGFGVRKIGENDPVTTDTVFQLASVSKPLSSTVIAALITKNLTTWDSPVNKPSITARYSDPWITSELLISDGFAHRSGLLGPAGGDLEVVGFNRSTILSRLQYAPESGPFRITYSYSNYGLTAAAVAAAKSTNARWEDAAQDYLYGPLGLTSTSSRDSDFLAQSNRANLHYPVSGSNKTWIPAVHRNADPQSPAGGASSNVPDLAKWVQLLMDTGRTGDGEQLISEAAVNASRLPQIVRGVDPITNHTGFYALGWDVDYRDGYTWVGHAGAFEQGVRTLIRYNVEAKIGFVGLTNCFPTGWPEGIADTVFDIALYGQARQDYVEAWNEIYSTFDSLYDSNPWAGPPPNNASSNVPVDAYVGVYSNNYVGTVRIIRQNNSRRWNNEGSGLILAFDDSPTTYPLIPWDRDTFLIRGSQPSENSGAIFSLSQDGTQSVGLTLTLFTDMQADFLARSG